MKLFYVHSVSEDGDSLDLLVWATDTREAKAFWVGYFDSLTDEVEPKYIGEVPLEPKAGPILWNDIIPKDPVT